MPSSAGILTAPIFLLLGFGEWWIQGLRGIYSFFFFFRGTEGCDENGECVAGWEGGRCGKGRV
jgi:hypothetical protein